MILLLLDPKLNYKTTFNNDSDYNRYISRSTSCTCTQGNHTISTDYTIQLYYTR